MPKYWNAVYRLSDNVSHPDFHFCLPIVPHHYSYMRKWEEKAKEGHWMQLKLFRSIICVEFKQLSWNIEQFCLCQIHCKETERVNEKAKWLRLTDSQRQNDRKKENGKLSKPVQTIFWILVP